MGYQIIGDTAMLLHFGFLAYVMFGGFLGWKWPKAFWPHLIIAAYGLGIVLIDWPCLLTEIEEWARVSNGGAPMPNGFIDHYLTGVIYPREHLLTSRIVIGAVVAVSWAGTAWRAAHRGGAAPVAAPVKKP
ncbi:uncharacterized protein DUF2784 [Murinocardiopsis flavida]|uniref:Uncharacterized protein DUF2784 n=1 Tax=Murinocardiopsis flavida TaxID=645275 RepID=A0A2P8CNM7_9ACTN|nr:DUF2784 domain-containing protein [Murinocardiopsis flavida]PSK86540.1 uncharacterized protein DUF2784 [Murinocardiopsis flavida]